MTKAETQFKEVATRVDVDELELEILDYWEQEKIFAKSLEQTKDKKLFTFYDGPPYATGKPHYGHILQSAIKDTVLRYKTMRGWHVPRRVGWDTHGLPVEVLVEKELGLKTKKDIEKYGIEAFNKKCREAVFRYIDEFTATLQRLGRWADYEHGYATLDLDYMESEWWVFKELWDKKLVYKDFRSTPYCIRCATPLSNFETGMGYKERTDQAVYVKLPVSPTSLPAELRGADQSPSLLIWTTTPWTLPGNVAVAMNPDISYVSVGYEGEELIVAQDLVEKIFGQETPVPRQWSSKELKELRYEPLYENEARAAADQKKVSRVVEAEFVNTEEGTGLVHIAPAFGSDDHELAKQQGLPVLRTVDTNGAFTVDPWVGKNLWEVNTLVIQDLADRGLLFKQEKYQHSYPHCWRCDEPLIYYALDSWFVKVSEIKGRMLAQNEKINWIPEHIKQGRFAKGIESAPDWAVSRNRFWSVPMPIWECQACDERVCVGSIEEVKKLSGQKEITDLHRPYVDELTWACASCQGTMKRIPEVLDVWFDSGSMPYAQWHYPFENKKIAEAGMPADLIVESIEMTRAWFYTLHVLAVALKDKPAFSNVIGSGIIFGDDGNKLSKKLKNYPEVEGTIAKYGADTIRLFFLASTLGEPYVFSEKELRQVQRKVYMTLWNVYSFFTRYATIAGWQPADGKKAKGSKPKMHLLDSWILVRLKQLEHEVIENADAYKIDVATRAFTSFIDDLSNWYVRRSRERFQVASRSGQPETDAAFSTMYEVLVRVAKLLAPFAPFIAEEIYRNLTGEQSVHLTTLADAPALSDEEQEQLREMAAAREIVSEALALRAKEGIKVRQPLAKLVVAGEAVSDELAEIICDEVNVKEVSFAKELPVVDQVVSSEDSSIRVALDTNITEELKEEGIARDIIRQGQILRREAGYELNDRITLVAKTNDATLEKVLETQRIAISDALQADEIVQDGSTDASVDFEVAGHKLHLGVRK